MEENELKIVNLTKNYKDVRALDSICYTFKNGLYGILGPNGAGKSTLINSITDNLKRESGEILWNGTDILKQGKSYRRILGYLPQEQGYYGEFSAYAFMMYMAELKGIKGKAASDRVNTLLNEVNMYEFKNKRIGKMSGGMKQRVLLAQSMLNDPKLLILDEPTAGVDPQERVRIRDYVKGISQNKIVLLSTHIVSDIEHVADEIIIMNKGKILCGGHVEALVKDVKERGFDGQKDEPGLEDVYMYWIDK